ncbi:hypothetical protein PVK06_047979 [Gossypium arboreum]|uniref:RNase H type-1 domain-containing protein n=1 Tax=Gossypium arboreum TaxID=29729 RepID=A0ABR0MGN8_GOSAR|nr:hypothetical protein PVK06_047979 [Gossypium arboreum]
MLMERAIHLQVSLLSTAVARNVHCKWLLGIGRNIGRCSVEQAELWAIYDELQFAWDLKWKEVTVDTDCATTINNILDGLKRYRNRDSISRIQELCKGDWQVLIKQISREANFASHILVGIMKEFPINPQVFHVTPVKVVDQIYLDIQSLHSNSIDISISL